MPKEFIERQATINAVAQDMGPIRTHDFNVGCARAVNRIIDVPAADVVELPCRIGDTVWCIRSFRGIDHPQETKVSGMYFTQDMRLNIQCKYVGIGEFGKKVFKTREDAMKAMEGQRA